MSRAWAGGSTRAWRRVRGRVLDRDGHRCRLRLGSCTTIATCVHHVHGRAVTGDDERYLVAACAPCNAEVGDPAAHGDPAPAVRAWW